MADLLREIVDGALPNVWLGATAENQARYDERVRSLGELAAAGWRTWWSFEPLLSAIDMRLRRGGGGVPADWAVGGGESGGVKARPCDVAWIRSIVQQCKAAGVPCYVKQLGANPLDDDAFKHDWPFPPRDRAGADPCEWPEDLRVRQLPEVVRAEG